MLEAWPANGSRLFIQSLSEVPGEAPRGGNFRLCRLGLAPRLLGPSEPGKGRGKGSL